MSLREATAVEATGPSEFCGAIAPGWDIAGNANGGYLLAIATRAALEATGRRDPVSVTAHFLAPAPPGPVTITTRVLKEGRRFATASATLASPERPLVAILGSFGDLEPGVATERLESGPQSFPHRRSASWSSRRRPSLPPSLDGSNCGSIPTMPRSGVCRERRGYGAGSGSVTMSRSTRWRSWSP